MRLNELGKIVTRVWNNLPIYFPTILLDQFICMPNHFHGIIIIVGAGLRPARPRATPNENFITQPRATAVRTGLRPAPTEDIKIHNLGNIVGAFKSFSAREINKIRGTPGLPVWQRNYYEHVIRNDYAFNKIREYIYYNPLRWELDRENPLRSGPDPFEDWLSSQGKIKEINNP